MNRGGRANRAPPPPRLARTIRPDKVSVTDRPHLSPGLLMAKRLDHVLVIDIEATCWDGGFPPKGETNDIIEIGLTPLELSTGRRLEKRSILVRPERSKVSPFCTSLTTLTQAQVDTGIRFKDACKLLEDEYLSQ